MRALPATELLGIWERARALPPVQRALELLAAACSETPFDSLADLPIGQRNVGLLRLREQLFGPRVTGRVACCRCSRNVELTFDIRDLLACSTHEPEAKISIRVEDYDLSFRLPNSDDLAVAVKQQDLAAIRETIMRRCLLSARREGMDTGDPLSATVLDAVSERLAKSDPLAHIELVVSCPHCEHSWRATFDIATFLWTEIEAWARRALFEVHTLAQAYGWREGEILALSAFRRRLYLEMVGA